jgi:hypothetical protein
VFNAVKAFHSNGCETTQARAIETNDGPLQPKTGAGLQFA